VTTSIEQLLDPSDPSRQWSGGVARPSRSGTCLIGESLPTADRLCCGCNFSPAILPTWPVFAKHRSSVRRELIKPSIDGVDLEQVHRFAFSQESEAPSDRRPRIRRTRRAAVALSALLLALRLVLLIIDTDGSSLVHPALYPSCGSASFEPPQSREGLCTVYEHSGIVVKNIVDRNSALRMPEYNARVLTWITTRTHVSNWREEPRRFPDGRGTLVSLEVEVGNPGTQALQYGPLIARAPVPSYRSHPPAELALPIAAGGPGEGLSVVAILNPRGAPGPSIFGQAPIAPHSSITGWISFVMSRSESELVGLPRSDLILSPVDENSHYVGIIRLWKDTEPDLPNGPA
jgi:hypothetical protein